MEMLVSATTDDSVIVKIGITCTSPEFYRTNLPQSDLCIFIQYFYLLSYDNKIPAYHSPTNHASYHPNNIVITKPLPHFYMNNKTRKE